MAKSVDTSNLGALASGVLNADDELRGMAQTVFRETLNQARYMLQFGTPQEKASLAKAMTPVLMRSLQDEKVDATRLAQREAYERMKAWARGDAAPVKPTDDTYPIVEDEFTVEVDPELEPEPAPPAKPKRTRKKA